MLVDLSASHSDLARSILDTSPDCIMTLSQDGKIVSVNDAGIALLKLEDPSALIGKDWVSLWSGQYHSQACQALHAAKAGQRRAFKASWPWALGKSICWDVVIGPIGGADDEIDGLVVISRDITEVTRALEEADCARAKLDAVLSSTTDNIVVVDHLWQVTYMNDKAIAAVGREGRLGVGKNLWDAYPEQVGTEFHQYYDKALKTQQPVTFEGYLSELAVWLEVHAFPNGGGLSIFFRDITKVKEARDQIYHLAHHDSLTGLSNRSVFLETLETSLADAVANKGACAVVYIDLDAFKDINDTLGHDAGDALLVVAARRLRDLTPASGLVARVGGDEFALLLCEDISFAQVERLMQRLRDAMSEPVSYLSTQISSRASFGAALYPLSDDRPTELLKNADLALYQAKRSGGNQYALFNPQVRQVVEQRVSALSHARDALARDAIIPFYQPKISFETGRVEGFEALLRWMHPTDGIQSPFLIKEAFDNPVLAVELGCRMRDKVMADMRRWREAGVNFGSIAVNVSAQELIRSNFSEGVLSRLAAAGLPTSMLEVDVTETVFLDGDSNAVEIELNDLHQNGVAISLDDFGTGYASLTHLNKFPVSWLKIDQSFVRGLGTDPDAAAIVSAVMGLAHSLGIRVVAEGVETLDQWHLLQKRGCDLAQGYLLSRPMSGERVADFIRTWAGFDQQFPPDTTASP